MTGSQRTAFLLVAVSMLGTMLNAGADSDPVTGRNIGGDAAARSFAEYCRDELPAERRSRFQMAMDDTEHLLAAGDTAGAGAALGRAWDATFRGGAETDTAVRCLGEQATRRWFNARLELWRLGSTAGMTGGRGADYTALYVTGAERGTDGIVAAATERPNKRFVAAYRSVADIVAVDESMRAYGTLILPEETRIVAAARDALPKLQAYARREHAAALAAEDGAFNRPPTQTEQSAMAQAGNFGKLAASMAGVDLGTANEQEAMVANRQVRESLNLLEDVRGLEIEPVFGNDDARRPSNRRAEQRGDTLLERGHDDAWSREFRDELYTLSGRYYAWCNCRDKAAKAAQAKQAIQPALLAERAERERKMAAAQAEMQQQGESLQQAVDDMQKTEAEKKRFNEEADALEAELDF